MLCVFADGKLGGSMSSAAGLAICRSNGNILYRGNDHGVEPADGLRACARTRARRRVDPLLGTGPTPPTEELTLALASRSIYSRDRKPRQPRGYRRLPSRYWQPHQPPRPARRRATADGTPPEPPPHKGPQDQPSGAPLAKPGPSLADPPTGNPTVTPEIPPLANTR